MRGFILNSNNENIKTCPKCNKKQDINNLYYLDCGNKFTRFDGLKLLRCPKMQSISGLRK